MKKLILITLVSFGLQNFADACPVDLTGTFSASDFYKIPATIKIEQNANCTEITFTFLKDKQPSRTVVFKTDSTIFGRNINGYDISSSYSDSALEVNNVLEVGLPISDPTRIYLDRDGGLVQEAGTVDNIVFSHPGLLSEQQLVKFERVKN